MKKMETLDSSIQVDTYIVSDEVAAVISFVAVGLLSTMFGAMGVCTNSLHLAVYSRQGTTDSASVTLTALAVSDMFISLFTFSMGLCITFSYLQIETSRVGWVQVTDMAFSWPRGIMTLLSATIIVFISAERALCVVWPLKVGLIVNRKQSIIAVTLIYIVISILFVPVYLTAGLSWQMVPTFENNKTSTGYRLQTWRAPDRDLMEKGANIYDTVHHFVCYCLTIFFTIIMIKGLIRSSRFRAKHAGSTDPSIVTHRMDRIPGGRAKCKEAGLSTRDKRVVHMVSAVTIMYIVCTFPVIFVYTWRFIDSNIIIGGAQENLLWASFSFVVLSESICASCNIFIYLTISTRYKETFCSLFRSVVTDSSSTI